MKSERMLIGEHILLTLWVGGLWTVGYLVAPVLFNSLEDRALAGALAGKLFHIMSYIGLFCGVLLLVGTLYRQRRITSRAITLALMLVMIVLGEFFIAPFIADLRQTGAVDTTAFAQAHGAASVLFLVTSLLGLFLVATSAKSS